MKNIQKSSVALFPLTPLSSCPQRPIQRLYNVHSWVCCFNVSSSSGCCHPRLCGLCSCSVCLCSGSCCWSDGSPSYPSSMVTTKPEIMYTFTGNGLLLITVFFCSFSLLVQCKRQRLNIDKGKSCLFLVVFKRKQKKPLLLFDKRQIKC